jgi:hypothetical protein
MPYIEVSKDMKRWSPYAWAWNCTLCQNIWMLDGSIDPNCETWERRQRDRERSELLTAVWAIGFKKRAPADAGALHGRTGQPEMSPEVAKLKDLINEDTAST